VTDSAPVGLNRIERVLAAMIATVAGLSILGIVAVLIGSFAKADFGSGVWPVVVVLPSVGLPIAFVLIVVFAILAVVRRRRAGEPD
jgi:hypothetical protein